MVEPSRSQTNHPNSMRYKRHNKQVNCFQPNIRRSERPLHFTHRHPLRFFQDQILPFGRRHCRTFFGPAVTRFILHTHVFNGSCCACNDRKNILRVCPRQKVEYSKWKINEHALEPMALADLAWKSIWNYSHPYRNDMCDLRISSHLKHDSVAYFISRQKRQQAYGKQHQNINKICDTRKIKSKQWPHAEQLSLTFR